MSVENFQVDRAGKTVKVWINSGPGIEKNMLAFTYECDSESEADLLRDRVEDRIAGRFTMECSRGIHMERRAWANNAAKYFEANADMALKAATTLCRVDDGVSGELHIIGGLENGEMGDKKAKLGKDRNKRLKALGNAIVPQIAYQIFKAIEEVNLRHEQVRSKYRG